MDRPLLIRDPSRAQLRRRRGLLGDADVAAKVAANQKRRTNSRSSLPVWQGTAGTIPSVLDEQASALSDRLKPGIQYATSRQNTADATPCLQPSTIRHNLPRPAKAGTRQPQPRQRKPLPGDPSDSPAKGCADLRGALRSWPWRTRLRILAGANGGSGRRAQPSPGSRGPAGRRIVGSGIRPSSASTPEPRPRRW